MDEQEQRALAATAVMLAEGPGMGEPYEAMVSAHIPIGESKEFYRGIVEAVRILTIVGAFTSPIPAEAYEVARQASEEWNRG